MSTSAAAPSTTVERGVLFGVPTLSYTCTSCGVSTETVRERDEEHAAAQMREHLADAHADALGIGRCERCGVPTDHFRARTQLGDVWLCMDHSPAVGELT